jgi:predicted SnoaL-like aldol condensation-catalyzing enzyme
MSQKQTAITFLTLSTSGKIREAYERHVAPNFRHHNAFFKGDRASLMTAMEANAKQNPNKTLIVKQALEDGDRVALFSHVKLKPEDAGIALVHIFRFEKGQIVELWDLGQPIPPDSPNENGMF